MISRLRSLLSAAIAFALVLGLGVGTANAATVEVKLGTDSGMLAFEPNTLNIKAGDTVKFVITSLAPHNAVFEAMTNSATAILPLLPANPGKRPLLKLEPSTSIASPTVALAWSAK